MADVQLKEKADEATARGIDHGWDAANYYQAYGKQADGDMSEQALARAMGYYPVGGHSEYVCRSAYRKAFVLGWERFMAGNWQDGTDRSDLD